MLFLVLFVLVGLAMRLVDLVLHVCVLLFTNFEEPSTKLAWPVASTSKNLENLSDKQSRYWRQLIDKIHKTSSRLGSHAPQFVLEPHVAHINHPQLQDLVHSQ